MFIDIKIPSTGESITEVTIAKWLKNDGDEVVMDEILCELESEKATFELNAEITGREEPPDEFAALGRSVEVVDRGRDIVHVRGHGVPEHQRLHHGDEEDDGLHPLVAEYLDELLDHHLLYAFKAFSHDSSRLPTPNSQRFCLLPILSSF